jgi:hypothetical protein
MRRGVDHPQPLYLQGSSLVHTYIRVCEPPYGGHPLRGRVSIFKMQLQVGNILDWFIPKSRQTVSWALFAGLHLTL